jgi:acyl-CoA synthetase (AMP-forming)/AMP-acid ligase II
MQAEAPRTPARRREDSSEVWESELSIPEILAATARRHPDAPLLIDGGASYDFDSTLAESERIARQLRGVGIEAGDRIVLWLPNGIEWIRLFFGALRIGAIIVPASTRLRSADLRHILADSGARALVYTPSFLGIDFERMVRELLRLRGSGRLPALEHVLTVGASDGVSATRELGGLPLLDRPDLAGPDASASAMVCYTSGTTGRPKGCVHSHRALVRNGALAVEITGLAHGERIGCPVPFAHVFGFHMGVLQATISGATVINAEPYAAPRMLDLAEQHEATVLYAVPAMARELVAEQNRLPRRLNVRVALVAGAPVSRGLRRSIIASSLASSFSIVYGCTEAPTISQLKPGADAKSRPDSVGTPTPGVQVRIAERGTTTQLPPGEIGEIITRGYNVMLGYLGDPGGTATRFRDGWLITGDLGSIDAAGFLHFASRADEMLVVGGFNAYPQEIEAQLEEMPGTREAAVIGVPDVRLGQVPMAWIVGEELDEEAVLDWSHRHIASYKRPRYVRVIEELPRLGSGKVARVRLREQARRLLPALSWEGSG